MGYFRKNLKESLSDPFLKNNLIFFFGSLLVSALNYIYHPILGRLLSLEDFGDLQAIVSLFTQITIVTSVFGIIVVNTISNQVSKLKTKYIIIELQRVAILITLSVFGVILLFGKQLGTALQFSSIVPFILLAILLPLGTTLGFRSAFLQGYHKFKDVSLINVISSFVKLLAAIVLVYLGFRTAGAIAGIIVAQIIAIIYAVAKTKKDIPILNKLPLLPTKNHKNESVEIKKELIYGVFIFLMLYAVTFLFTVDILVVKRYFDPVTSGLYGGISTIARIIFFATSSVAGVLLPSIKKKDNEGNNQKILMKSLILILVVGIPSILIFAIAPKVIVSILLGSKFQAFANFLPFLSLSIFVTSVVNVFIYYFIALKRFYTVALPMVGIALFALLSSLYHARISAIILDLVISNVVVLLLILSYYFLKERRTHEK